MSTSEPTTSFRSDPVKLRVLIVMILGAGIAFLDSSVVTVALPAIQRELGITTAEQQWVASIYLLTLSTLLLVGGRLADMYGRKRLFITGIAAYAFLGLVAVLAPSGTVLIAARGLQGVAGALLVPTTLAIINAVFPAAERGKAIGIWAAWSGITTALGPVLGGFIIDTASWRYALLITPVFALLCLSLVRPVPETRDEDADKRIDVIGVVLVVVALGAIVFGLIQAPISGWTAPEVLGAMALGVVALPAFIWWEGRARNPVMPYGMFSNRNLAVANVVTFFVYAGLYGMFFYIPIYVQTALGASATLAASISLPIPVMLFVLSPYAGSLNDRYGPRWLMCFGPLVAALGMVVASFTGPNQLWLLLVPGIVIFGVGLGFTVAPVTATAIGAAEERYSGVASGFNNGVSRVAGLIAIALMGVIVVQLWQFGIGSAAEGAEPEVRTAVEQVREMAFVTPPTEDLAEAQAEEVRRIASEASEEAFRNSMLLAAALVAIGGVVSAVGIRGPQRHE